MIQYIVGDVHGELEKVKQAINIAGDNQIIWLGDYLDSYHVKTNVQLETLELIMSRKNDVWLLGNHDNQYLFNSRVTSCSGRQNLSYDAISLAINKHKEKFKHCQKLETVDGDYFLTHGGITTSFLNSFLAYLKEKANVINGFENIDQYLNLKGLSLESPVYYCSQFRGGVSKYPGIFWCDYQELVEDVMMSPHRKMLAPRQIVGHSQRFCQENGYARLQVHDKDMICIDSLQSLKPHIIKCEDGVLSFVALKV